MCSGVRIGKQFVFQGLDAAAWLSQKLILLMKSADKEINTAKIV